MVSAILSRFRRTLGLLLLAGLASPAVATQSPLLEAALLKRAELEAARAIHGTAPRFTDLDLSPDPHAFPPSAPPPPPESEPEPELPEAVPAETGDAELRESELRKRLTDLEAALVSIGASGLPLAPRDPNRFRSALDAARLRAELEDTRQELEELLSERR